MAVNIYNQVPFNAYTPKSFQEMLAPVMYASEQEEKLQEQYAQTGSTIDKATAYLNPELDKETYAKMQQYKAHALYMETNADKGLMLEKITAHPLAKTWAIQPFPYRETQNKQDKISSVLKSEWERLVFAQETDERYLSLICDWNANTKSLDDPPDSLASILRESGFSAGGSWMNLYKYY